MSPRRLQWFIDQSCWLASFAYAARMKRLGRGYFVGVVAALCSSVEDPGVLYSGPLPSRVQPAPTAQAWAA